MRLLNCIIHSQVIVQPRSVISQVDYVCNAVVQGVVKLSVPLMQRGGVDFLKVVLLFLFLLSLVVTDFWRLRAPKEILKKGVKHEKLVTLFHAIF